MNSISSTNISELCKIGNFYFILSADAIFDQVFKEDSSFFTLGDGCHVQGFQLKTDVKCFAFSRTVDDSDKYPKLADLVGTSGTAKFSKTNADSIEELIGYYNQENSQAVQLLDLCGVGDNVIRKRDDASGTVNVTTDLNDVGAWTFDKVLTTFELVKSSSV